MKSIYGAAYRYIIGTITRLYIYKGEGSSYNIFFEEKVTTFFELQQITTSIIYIFKVQIVNPNR